MAFIFKAGTSYIAYVAQATIVLFVRWQSTVNILFSVSYDCNMQLTELQKNCVSMVPALEQISAHSIIRKRKL